MARGGVARARPLRSTVSLALILLVIQNSASITLLSHLQKPQNPHVPRYEPLTAITLSEVFKLIACLLILLADSPPTHEDDTRLSNVFHQIKDRHLHSIVPATLFTAAITCQHIGAQRLDPMPFTVLSQLKLVFTPVFGKLILGQGFTLIQWACLLMITTGIVVVHLQSAKVATETSLGRAHSVGLVAMIVAGICVASAGVYMERMLKAPGKIMARNAQLACYSSLFAVGGLLWRHIQAVTTATTSPFSTFFHGYRGLVWVSILLQAAGGFIVAWCVRVSGTVSKNYAQSVGFLVASVTPMVASPQTGSFSVLLGVLLVLGGIIGSVWQSGQAQREKPEDQIREKV